MFRQSTTGLLIASGLAAFALIACTGPASFEGTPYAQPESRSTSTKKAASKVAGDDGTGRSASAAGTSAGDGLASDESVGGPRTRSNAPSPLHETEDSSEGTTVTDPAGGPARPAAPVSPPPPTTPTTPAPPPPAP